MSKTFDSDLPDRQDKVPHLRLVASNPSHEQDEEVSPVENFGPGFSAQVRKKGPALNGAEGNNLFTLIACDLDHSLEGRFDLEFHADAEDLEPMSVTCHFPELEDRALFEAVEEDETLWDMLLIRFRLKVLEQMLLFCAKQGALHLLVYTLDNPEEGHALKVYSGLVLYEDRIPTTTGKMVQMVIPVTPRTIDRLHGLMGSFNQSFREALWEGHSSNPTIRSYLKANPHLDFFNLE